LRERRCSTVSIGARAASRNDGGSEMGAATATHAGSDAPVAMNRPVTIAGNFMVRSSRVLIYETGRPQLMAGRQRCEMFVRSRLGAIPR
jgi:hypothetical protein